MSFLRSCPALCAAWLAASNFFVPFASAEVAFAGFTRGSYLEWKSLGAAFASPLTVSFHDGYEQVSSDRLTENGKGTEGSLYSADFVIEQRFINLELAGGDHAFRAAASLWVDGNVVRTSTGGNRESLTWVTWDVSEWVGKTAHVGLHDYCIEDERAYISAGRIEFSSHPRAELQGDVEDANRAVGLQALAAIRKNAPRASQDPYRPVYHYTPPSQRMNDPNGPGWSNGYHHVFYQHMVFVGFGPATNVHWGHARSRDLVNWETLPLAVAPEYARGELSCFSGNLAWDGNGDPVQFVTMVPYKRDTHRQIWPARPLDPDWIRWERTPEKPPHGLVPKGEPSGRNLKDAFPFRVGKRNFLVLTDRDIPVYEAVDTRLTTWEHRGVIDPESAECPNFFEVDGHWLYLSSPHQPVRYRIGDFDPKTAHFTARAEGRLNHDSGFYASTAYRDNQGRTVLLGVSRGQKDGRGWTGALALPRILTVGPDGLPRMRPAPELQALRREPFRLEKPVVLRNQSLPIPNLAGDTLEVVARFQVKDARSFGLHVRRSAGGERFLPVQWRDGEITVVKPTPDYPCRYELDPVTREVVFHVFLDKGLLDACTGDGRIFESRIHYAPLEDLGIGVFSEGGEATLVSLEAWQMAPANINHDALWASAEAER